LTISLTGKLRLNEVIQNVTVIYWHPTIGLFLIVVMMSVSFTVMVVCAIKMYRSLKKTTMSKKLKSVETQLLKALVVQVRKFCIFVALSHFRKKTLNLLSNSRRQLHISGGRPFRTVVSATFLNVLFRYHGISAFLVGNCSIAPTASAVQTLSTKSQFTVVHSVRFK
uniref:G_PROTEIN_RECEP_F1_2 domain-containing protein n=1 Tax=Heligmosomoides polygyrus TaxID=6339 RepID=A0A183FHM1_HELPZ